MAGPAVSRRTYLLTFVGLLTLTLLTTLLGLVDMGPFNTVVALAIAVMKASLIAMFFMHTLNESPLVRVVMAGGIIWFLILISLTMSDYLTRG
jgi:cytochrome c oxidase subunit 4